MIDDHVHLDPELTWEDCATYVYGGVIEGKLGRNAFIEFFRLSGQEMSQPLHSRVMGKALGAFFRRDYPDLREGEFPGVLVCVSEKNYIVSHNNKQITIEVADDIKEEDCSFLIKHETEADARISAWESGERYVERTD